MLPFPASVKTARLLPCHLLQLPILECPVSLRFLNQGPQSLDYC